MDSLMIDTLGVIVNAFILGVAIWQINKNTHLVREQRISDLKKQEYLVYLSYLDRLGRSLAMVKHAADKVITDREMSLNHFKGTERDNFIRQEVNEVLNEVTYASTSLFLLDGKVTERREDTNQSVKEFKLKYIELVSCYLEIYVEHQPPAELNRFDRLVKEMEECHMMALQNLKLLKEELRIESLITD